MPTEGKIALRLPSNINSVYKNRLLFDFNKKLFLATFKLS